MMGAGYLVRCLPEEIDGWADEASGVTSELRVAFVEGLLLQYVCDPTVAVRPPGEHASAMEETDGVAGDLGVCCLRSSRRDLTEAAPSGERAVQPSSSWTGITILMGGAVVCAHRQGRCGLGRTAICREKGETRRGRAQGWCSRELAADAPFADPGARVGRGE